MSGSHALHLVWDNHLENVSSLFQLLYQDNKFVDVTIACRDGLLRAHKLILSACSTYFEKIFQENPCKHPVVIIRGIRYQEMKMILEYIYKGFIDIPANLLNNLICVASELEIKGFENFQNYQGAYQDTSKDDDKNTRIESSTLSKKRAFNDEIQISSVSYPSSSVQPLAKKRMVVNTSHGVEFGNSDDRRQAFVDSEPNTSNAEVSSIEEFNYKDGIFSSSDLPFKITKVVAEKEWMDNEESYPYSHRQYGKNDDQDYVPSMKAHRTVTLSGNEYDEFVCSLCFYKCHSRRDYLLHEKSHTKTEKPHKCEFCPSSFTRSSHLARHRRMHTGERPFNCMICDKSFARQDKLKQHVRTSHAAQEAEIMASLKRIPEKLPEPPIIRVIPQEPIEEFIYQEPPTKVVPVAPRPPVVVDPLNKVKRGRGRPRKYPLVPAIVPQLGPKRGRGRPRKVKPDVDNEILDNIKEECRSPKPLSEEDYSFEMSGEEHITIEPLIEINTESHQFSISHEDQQKESSKPHSPEPLQDCSSQQESDSVDMEKSGVSDTNQHENEDTGKENEDTANENAATANVNEATANVNEATANVNEASVNETVDEIDAVKENDVSVNGNNVTVNENGVTVNESDVMIVETSNEKNDFTVSIIK